MHHFGMGLTEVNFLCIWDKRTWMGACKSLPGLLVYPDIDLDRLCFVYYLFPEEERAQINLIYDQMQENFMFRVFAQHRHKQPQNVLIYVRGDDFIKSRGQKLVLQEKSCSLLFHKARNAAVYQVSGSTRLNLQCVIFSSLTSTLTVDYGQNSFKAMWRCHQPLSVTSVS